MALLLRNTSTSFWVMIEAHAALSWAGLGWLRPQPADLTLPHLRVEELVRVRVVGHDPHARGCTMARYSLPKGERDSLILVEEEELLRSESARSDGLVTVWHGKAKETKARCLVGKG